MTDPLCGKCRFPRSYGCHAVRRPGNGQHIFEPDPVLFLWEEKEQDGGYHRFQVGHATAERDWSDPYPKSGVATYRSRVVAYVPRAHAVTVEQERDAALRTAAELEEHREHNARLCEEMEKERDAAVALAAQQETRGDRFTNEIAQLRARVAELEDQRRLSYVAERKLRAQVASVAEQERERILGRIEEKFAEGWRHCSAGYLLDVLTSVIKSIRNTPLVTDAPDGKQGTTEYWSGEGNDDEPKSACVECGNDYAEGYCPHKPKHEPKGACFDELQPKLRHSTKGNGDCPSWCSACRDERLEREAEDQSLSSNLDGERTEGGGSEQRIRELELANAKLTSAVQSRLAEEKLRRAKCSRQRRELRHLNRALNVARLQNAVNVSVVEKHQAYTAKIREQRDKAYDDKTELKEELEKLRAREAPEAAQERLYVQLGVFERTGQLLPRYRPPQEAPAETSRCTTPHQCSNPVTVRHECPKHGGKVEP